MSRAGPPRIVTPLVNPVNAMYGHDLILSLHAGLGACPRPIWGFLQHAWMPELPFWEGEQHSRRWPVFVFSKRNLDAARAWGLGSEIPVRAIGDPFVYLARLLTRHQTEDPRVRRSENVSTILYPNHADGRDSFVAENARLAEVIREREGADVTVCLHGHDWKVPAIRDVYTERGFRVICHGYGDDPQFLFAQHAELLRHDRVISNQVGTALFHGGLLGLHMEVLGPVFEQVESPITIEEADRYQRERWPALFQGGLGGPAGIALAEEELGADQVRGPEELADLLGWRGLERVRTEAVARVLTVRRELRERRGR